MANLAPDAELMLFSGVLVFGFLAGLARTLRNGNYKSLGHSLSVAAVSGFLAFGVTSVIFRPPYENVWGTLGCGTLIGLLGRDVTDKVIMAALKKLGLTDGRNDEPDTR